MVGQGVDHRRHRHVAMLALFREGRRLLDLAPDDVAGDQHDHAHQEGNPPSPRHEGVVRQRVGQGQKDRSRQNLARLHALQGETGEISAPPERRVFEDHRTRARNLARDRKSLDQPQPDQEDRRPYSDLPVGRQQADRHRRQAHQKEADQQHVLAAVRIAQMAEHERADRSCDIADPVSRQRRDDRDFGIARGKEDLRKHQRGRGRIDEEVIIFERGADPAARRRGLGLTLALQPMRIRCGHSSLFLPYLCFYPSIST